MAVKQIVSIRSGWGILNADTWKRILSYLAKGESIGIWYGRRRDMPKWNTGKCSLRVKVGKKRKLVKGQLSETYEGFDDGGETYGFEFAPNKPRSFIKEG